MPMDREQLNQKLTRAREILALLIAGTATDSDRDEVLIILLELGV